MSFILSFRRFLMSKSGFIALVMLVLTLPQRPVDAAELGVPIEFDSIVANGGGSAVMTALAPAGELGGPRRYSLQFAMIAGFIGGSAEGYINFVFGDGFSGVWGAVPPNSLLFISGNITEIAQDDGYTVLRGTLREADYTRRQGVVFLIDDLFEIKVGGDLGANEFILQWCLLPSFLVKVTDGDLSVSPLSLATTARLSATLSKTSAGISCSR
jgi:hypothetical protein